MSEISNTTTSTGGFMMPKIKGSVIIIGLYLLFLLLPIYWLLTMSLKTNSEILNSFTLWPHNLTFGNYTTILTDYLLAGSLACGLCFQPLYLPR